MQSKTVYYLTHKDTGRDLKYYTTLAGARIAQRSRNHRLGFHPRVDRVNIQVDDRDLEAEQCRDINGALAIATYCIREDHIEQEDILE